MKLPKPTILFLVIACTLQMMPDLQAQWMLRLDAGLLQGNAIVGPASADLTEAARTGVLLGGGVEVPATTRLTVSLEAAWRERGVYRYYREQMVEEHRYRCVDASAVLRWSPADGALRPHALLGAGLSFILDALVQFGFHEHFNFIQGTDGIRTTVPFVVLGAGLRYQLPGAPTVGVEGAWQPFLSDIYRNAAAGGHSFKARDVLVSFSIALPLGVEDRD
ncbi:MAG: hypothetical protein M5R41_00055 [Bacteroidia bacterium]|nr:hypothetical protein [Bacteroidia bacterium]